MALAKGCNTSFIPSRASTGSACSPSHNASRGSWWLSTIRPSASAATAAFESGTTRSRRPAAWEGSTITGRSVSLLATITAERSSVKRVLVSKVRIPRSHNTTLSPPAAVMYSAASSHSSTVAESPLNVSGWIMPLVVFTLVFTPAETSMLPGKLPALDLKVADAMQDELEDISHRGVVDRTWVAIDYPPQDLLLTFGVVDGGTRLCLEIHDLLHDARPLAQRQD